VSGADPDPVPATQRELVVLVHGLWMNRCVMGYLAHKLRCAGYATASFGYFPALRSFEHELGRFVSRMRAYRYRRLHFVAHSLGGVLVFSALPRLSDLDIGRVVCLGSPLRGSLGAKQFMRHAFGRFCIGASAKLWQSFPALRCGEGIEAGVIAGTRRFGLGRFFTDLPAPNDGVVTVEETRIDGLCDHIVLPCSHTGMLFAPEAARQIVQFLRTGRFLR